MVSVDCGKRTWQLKTLCGQNAKLINLEAGDTNFYYCIVKN